MSDIFMSIRMELCYLLYLNDCVFYMGTEGNKKNAINTDFYN